MKSFLQHLTEAACPHCGRIPDSEDIEMELVNKIDTANTEDLKEYPGAKGEAKHNALHKTIKNMVDTMRTMHTGTDGDYTDAPEQTPMSDTELEKYFQEWSKKHGPASNENV